MSTPAQPSGISFTRKRTVRTAAGVASAGLLAGFSLVAATPAMAATDADCVAGNTVDALTGTAADIQTLLDADTPVICISGTFVLDTSLQYDYSFTLHGLTDAVLDGDDAVTILENTGPDTELQVENVRFTNAANSAIFGTVVTVINSQFDNNSGFIGGAINAYSVYSNGSTFFLNDAVFGGAIAGDQTVEVVNSTFTENTATFGGAIMSYGFFSSDSSTFFDNSAEYEGGAVLVEDEATIVNSTFVDNSTVGEGSEGGAVSMGYGLVLQSTFLDNTSTGDGQSVSSDDPEETSLRGNIFAGTGSAAQLATDEPEYEDLGGNQFTTAPEDEPGIGTPGPGTIFALTTAALFDGAALADNGGPTQTVALYAGSPAVNGVPVGEPSVETDQRGVDRDELSDAGAYEWVGAVSPDGPALAATGSTPPVGLLGGAAALLLAAGAFAIGLTRRSRTR